MNIKERNRVYHRVCRICGRRLVTKKSRKLGFGSVCARKVKDRVAMEKLEAKGQLRLF